MEPKDASASDLDPVLTRLLIRLQIGWTPPKRRYDAPVELAWGDDVLPAATTQLVEEDAELVVVVSGAPASLVEIGGTLGNQRLLTAAYADGYALDAPRTFLFSQSMSFGGDKRGATVKLRASTWSVRDPEVEPAFWLMPLGEEILDGPGNLALRWRAKGRVGGGAISVGHFALRGRHDYFVVEQSERSKKMQWLVMPAIGIDARDPADTLYSDFVALQYLAGRRLCVRRMFGVTANLDVVAEAGVHLGQPRVPFTDIAPPIPLRTARRPWVVPFFSALSQVLARGSEDATPLRVALVWCTEATSDTYIDGRLLRLGAAVRAVLGSGVESEPTEVICDARYRELGLSLADSAREALRATDGLMARGLLPEYGSDFIEKHLTHVAEVRGVVAQLVAKTCGYGGPLGGEGRYDAEPSDEEKHDASVPIERILASAELPSRPTTVEWGDFGLIDPSEVSALAPAIEMAELLERHTDGRVAGRLRWSARTDEQTTWFDLEAYLARDARTHLTLASVGYRPEGGVVIVRGPGGEESSHRDAESLSERLVAFGKSPEVRKSVTSLLGLDQALGVR